MSLEAVTPIGPRAFLEANPCNGPMRCGVKRFWTGREEVILRQHYPDGGLPASIERLPGRTATAIYQRARQLGLKSPLHTVTTRQSYGKSEAVDDVIRRLYPAATTRGAVQRLAETINRPSWWVGKRAAALGLVQPRFSAPRWSAEEDQILFDHHRLGIGALKRRLKTAGFNRTDTAIGVRLKRRHLSVAQDSEDFTARGLSEVMGIDGKTVLRWIEKGWLKAREEPAGWRIKPKDIRAFIIENAAAVDIRKVEKDWFIDLLAGRQA